MGEATINTAGQAPTPDGGTGAAGTPGAAGAEPEKKYTQAELDAAIGQRLARERRGMPSQEELSAFRAWKESQQTEQERQQTLLNERNSFEQRASQLESELEQARRERTLIARGVPSDDVDYYAYKIGKLVSETTTFEQAAENFMREHPPVQAGAEPVQKMRASFGAPMGQPPQGESLSERINRQLRGK